MTEFRDFNDQTISEADALSAPLQQDFSIHWDDGKTAYCFRAAEDRWAVRIRANDVFYPRGSVTRVAQLFQPDGVHGPEETFSAAVRKLIEH